MTIALPQATDFREESTALFNLIADLTDEQLLQPTLFKQWSINDIITHLHVWNHAAYISLQSDQLFTEFFDKVQENMTAGRTMRQFEPEVIDHISGRDLVAEWHSYFSKIAHDFSECDPKKRLKWAGPDMSARSSISARLMETWAHAQAVYDMLGVQRQDKNRIRNIVVLGVNTFSYCFNVNGLETPEKVPQLKLSSPEANANGHPDVWIYGEDESNTITGTATEFCQVVTQTRNIADTKLQVNGPTAHQWMQIAQCFAGTAETPPAPGTRQMQ